MAADWPSAPSLHVEELEIVVRTASGGWRRAVDGLSLGLQRGETLALVGESGSGKSLTGLAMLALAPSGVRIAGGRVLLGATDLLGLDETERSRWRGRVVAHVPQEAHPALNPVRSVGAQLIEAQRTHLPISRGQARDRSRALLEELDLGPADELLAAFPHQLSGGQAQRIAIALALAARPSFVVADEPTSALDVSTQARVLELLASTCAARGVGLLVISHDLRVVAGLAPRTMVMLAGGIVEEGPTATLFADPLHPYTRALVAAGAGASADPAPLPQLATTGCAFAPRCSLVEEICRRQRPELRTIGQSRAARCPPALEARRQ